MAEGLVPQYWKEACETLSQADPVMARIIEVAGRDNVLQSRGQPFETMLRSIVGQQISTRAANSIWDRFQKACPELEPRKIMRKHRKTLRSTGLSERKIDYILDICRFFDEEIQEEGFLENLEDDEIIKKLITIKGVGEWTAQMFLIFALLRPNVLPLADLGLIRAIELNYFPDDGFSGMTSVQRMNAIREVSKKWLPWQTVATWYLWRSLQNGQIQY